MLKNGCQQEKPEIGGDAAPTKDVVADLVRHELTVILESQSFRQSVRMARFLQYVVETALTGSRGDLKETAIAVAVYDRLPGYDPKLDPVVRNEARRLRQKLQQHYASRSDKPQVTISLPVGGYLPAFAHVPEHPRHEDPKTAAASTEATAPYWRATLSPLLSRVPLASASTFTVLQYGLLLIGVAVIGLMLSATLPKAGEPLGGSQSAKVIPLTAFKGKAFQPAISPDGRNIAFVWNGDANGGNFDIYVTQRDGKPLRITTDEAYDVRPSWSPDGLALAYLRSGATGTDVMTITVPGGQPKRIAALRSPLVSHLTEDPTQVLGNPGPAWTRDGSALIIADQDGSSHALSLFRYDLRSGNATRLTTPQGESRDYSPKVSPSGKWLTFVRNTSNSSADLYLMSTDGGEARRITDERADILGATWYGDDRHIIFSSNRSGAYALWLLDIERSTISTLPAAGEGAMDPSASTDGKILAYTDLTFLSNIHRLSLGPNRSKADEELFGSTKHSNSARYSPDGTKIAFASDRSGTWEIWVSDSEASQPRRLTHFEGPMVGTPRWSPDGRSIVFDARPSGHSVIFVASVRGGEPKPLFLNDYEERQPSWSHDGKYIYFYSNRSGHGALWRSTPEGTDAREICTNAPADPQESRDGSTIYFTSIERGFLEVDSHGGQAKEVVGLNPNDVKRLWELRDNLLYFVESSHQKSYLRRYDTQSHIISPVSKLIPGALGNTPSISISPDGASVLYDSMDDATSNIVLMQVGIEPRTSFVAEKH